MKVNLLIDNPGDVRSGYLNIDPIAEPGDVNGRIKGDIGNLSEHVDAGEADEIVALDILDYFPTNTVDIVLNNWLTRLRHGGRLTMSVVDIREVARGVLAGNLSPNDYNELLYGKQEQPWQFKKSIYTLNQIAEVLANLGFKILSKRIQNLRAVITIERS